VSDAARLREIAYAAKAHWGFDTRLVREWADSLDVDDGRILLVEEQEGVALAWASLIPQGDVCVLEDLWVEPRSMGRGLGARLFRRAEERAHELGAARLEWEAEPNAVGFYEKMGARYLRDSEPSEWGRILPVMGVDLQSR
jgi:GNAT superfamily N-acetyltransferase